MSFPKDISIFVVHNFPLPQCTPILVITATNTLLIKRSLTSTIRNTNIANLIPNLIPVRTRRRNGGYRTQRPISTPSNEEPAEEVQIVDVRCTLGHRPSDRTNKSDDVDQDTADIGRVAAPMEAKGEEIWGPALGAVQILDLEVAFAHDVVVADDDAGDGGEEDRVSAKIGREIVGG